MKRVVVFANGALSHPERVRSFLRPTDIVFCADGGANHALALGIIPHRVIGDLDSLTKEVERSLRELGVVPERHPVDKDETDLELTLRAALDEGPHEVVLLSALGHRLDQLLANIFIMTHEIFSDIRFSIFDGDQSAFLVRAGEEFSLDGQLHETISLLPLTPRIQGLSLTGVQWELSNAELSHSATRAISNRITQERVHLRFDEGLLLVVHIHA